MTVAIVAVSHSLALAEAAVELARQMVPDNAPPIAIAAGAGEGVIGTDAVAIAAAIDRVATADGVLVVMDLGSAILSAELALELVTIDRAVVRLSTAPFVEGLLAAIVRAAGGAGIDEVAAEAAGALRPKVDQLSGMPPLPSPGGDSDESARKTADDASAPVVTERVVLTNPSGLHARPAAAVATETTGWNADITLSNITHARGPVPADSSIMIMTLGAGPGDEVEIAAAGSDAKKAVASLSAMMRDGFGET